MADARAAAASGSSGRLAQAQRIAERQVAEARRAIEARADRHTLRVLDAFESERLAASDFAPSTGYGYDAVGRDKLERVWARLMGAEAALVRPHLASGTAAVAHMLFAAAAPGDEVLVATGDPYDTVAAVLDGTPGSLAHWQVASRILPFAEGTDPDVLARALGPRTRIVLVQRSRGYSARPALTVAHIGTLAAAVHGARADVAVVVDNCYGEFVEALEPTAVGADLAAGAWTKNPGGGLATTGGYVAGRRDLVARAAGRLTAPGQGAEVGAVPEGQRLAFQGLLLAPGAVAEALVGGVYATALFAALGFDVDPAPAAPPGARADIVSRVTLGRRDLLLAALGAIQAASPVDARALPEPAAMPGYPDAVAMAAGTFVQGGGLELSADAPMRPPWQLFVQGGLRLAVTRRALDRAAQAVLAALADAPIAAWEV